jgi:hypothetical protein
MPGYLGCHDVSVIAIRDRHEGVRFLDSCLSEHVFINTCADYRVTLEIVRESPERAGLHINN